MSHRHTNRLIHETSPYLLQHAHNPVDWHAWNDEALERARREDKPILLSIGYSACHWCHVMEHESFEDDAVANVMNELYVCIKVDREERPDLDKIYQLAHQVLAQRGGGWPLTTFLAPHDHVPFYSGTYFPKTPRYGMPGFVEVLQGVASFYRDKRTAVGEQNERLREVFARLQQQAPTAQTIAPAVLTQASGQLKRQYDARYGGFGQAPKFPHPTSIELCLRQWARGRTAGAGDAALLDMARHTLRSMALGGMHDQLGGGFCRYSVDDQWMIPHFEKMLYDNGQLLTLYADAYAATHDPLFRRTALDTAAWVMREMQSPGGGYYSSLDADSEGHEGKFYVWEADAIKSLLSVDEWELIETRYGLDGTPNFEGQWNLHTRLDNAALAQRFGVTEDAIEMHAARAQQKLLAARAARVRPARDDKILTSWNALMIKGMARAAWRLDDATLLTSAQRAFDFVRANLWKEGRLLATTKDGKAHLSAYLDDYVFLIDAGLELLQAQWRSADLTFVRALADVVLEHFEDKTDGGFFFTGDDHERLVYRPKPAADEATPSGNGIGALVLMRLAHLLGEPKYLDAAERTLKSLYGTLLEYPSAHGTLLTAIEEYLEPAQLVIVRASADDARAWIERARRGYVPWRLSFAIAPDASDLPPALAARGAGAAVTAYLCQGHACSAAQTKIAEFDAALAAGGTET